jgi:lipopolysaccharide export system permease protein
MSILTRHVIKAHVGPFIFAFTAVTGLLFLNAVAQRLEDLVGKGLEASVLLEFMLLSFPHIVALTFPMSILVAVLYAFSDMTGNNEVMALAAGGVHPGRLLAPLLAVGLLLTGVMYYFNDQVLPESNHRLSSLLSDVGSKSPTFELREEIINEVHTMDDTRYFLRARGIDQATNRLTDVTIYDLTRMGEHRTIVAERGEMAFTSDRSDLYLTLEDGVVYETADDRPGGFQRLYFDTQVIPFRGVGVQLQRRTGAGTRSDREMTIAMLRDRVDQNLQDVHNVADDMREASLRALERALEPGPQNDAPSLAATAGVGSFHDPVLDEITSEARINQHRWRTQYLNVYQYSVEIHKKYAIAVACFIFVLLGVPMAIRFPQGGVGMVIALSLGIFFLYWVGLIVGERFADRGQIHPWLAMWAPNLILLGPALVLVARMGREMSTNRGSRWVEVRWWLRSRLLPDRKRGAAGEGALTTGESAA